MGTLTALMAAGYIVFVRVQCGDGLTPPTYAPWVVATIRQPQFSFRSVQDQKQRVVFRRRGYLVLHRAGPARG